MPTTIDDTMRNAGVAAQTALLNGGDLQILTAGGAVISTHALSATAFGAPVAGVATANPIASATAVAGVAASYRLRTSTGAARLTGDVVVVAAGEPAPENALGLLTLTLVAGTQINIPSFTYRQPAQ